MALVTPVSRHLQLQFQAGTSANGQPKLQNRNFAHVSPAAADDDVLAVGQALAALCAQPLYAVTRVDQSSLAAGTPAPAVTTGAGSTSSTAGGTTSGS
ncbi:MAG: DUF1659 domain-containing protein [Alicyclobacillus sp.]|nr:DUF1659 domain-containing protein [Alicyclobacillus sp.]